MPQPFKKARKLDLSIRGRSGAEVVNGRMSTEIMPRLRGQRGQQVYLEMGDNDPIIGTTLYVLTSLMLQAPWRVEPAVEHDPVAQKWADFVEENLGDMAHTWDEFMEAVQTRMQFGWSAFEINLKYRRGYNDDPGLSSRYSDGMVGLHSLQLRDQLTLARFEFTENNDILGMYQNPPMGVGMNAATAANMIGGQLFIPMAKMLLFRIGARANNPEGRSALRPAVLSFLRKKRIEDIELIGIERELAGYPVVLAPMEYFEPPMDDGSADEDALAAETQSRTLGLAELSQLVTEIRRDEREGAVFPCEEDREGKPTGFKLKLLSSGGSRAIPIDPTIRRYDQSMAMTTLCGFVLTGTQNVGSHALHSSQTDVFDTSLRGHLRSIQQELNRKLIPLLCDLNGCPPDMRPTFEVGDVAAPSLTDVAQYIQTLASAGYYVTDAATERKLREIGGLPDRLADDDMPGGGGRASAALAPPTDGAALDALPPAAAAQVAVAPDAPGADVPEDSAAAAVAGTGQTVASVTLNGAQLQAAVEIVNQVVAGTLPRDAARGLLMVAFALDGDKADLMLGSAAPRPGAAAPDETAPVAPDEGEA